MMEKGDQLPEFEVKNQEGADVNSDDIGNAVIYFYPKAGTSGCTTEASDFNDSLNQFQDLDFRVYGVSTDTVGEQRNFHQNQNLGFELLADPDGEVSEKFGVLDGEYAERTTFVIRNGEVEKVFRKVDPEGHVAQLIEYLRDRYELRREEG